MKLYLDRKLRKRIPEEYPLTSSLAEHVAGFLTARLRGLDGKTGYERVRSRPCGKRMIEFREEMLYKLPMKRLEPMHKAPLRQDGERMRARFVSVRQ